MRYAKVLAGDVVEIIIESGPLGAKYSKGMISKLFPCPAEVEVGWHYDGSTYSGPTQAEVDKKEADDLLEARTVALLDQIDKLMDILEGNDTITQADVELVRSIGT